MPVPDFQTLMLPVLRLFGEGATNVADCLPRIRAEFAITDEEAEQMIPSGRVTVLASRVRWARTYLSKAGLLTSPRRNNHVITEAGRDVLERGLTRVDIKTLEGIDAFAAWRAETVADATETETPARPLPAETDIPEDRIEAAFQTLNAALRDDLLALLRDMPPLRFEDLIRELLRAMGFGGGSAARSFATRASGDGGIDGIIHEDALGLDAVYIQAKRYAEDIKVGRPAIQQFVGSLTGEGATKGVFVTTSGFSAEARAYVERVQQRIVLIDGQRLAQMMIDWQVGVRPRKTYVICSVDEDSFAPSA